MNKTVVITGSSGLMGRALVRHFAGSGWNVIGIDKEPCTELQQCEFVKFDLTRIREFDLLAMRILKLTEFSPLTCLINNAAFNPKIEGGAKTFEAFEDIDLEEWDREMRLNLTVPVFLTKELLFLFDVANGQAKVINVVSTYGLVAPNQNLYDEMSKEVGRRLVKPIGYPVTKAGLVMATKYLGSYLAGRGFNVNGIAPSGISAGQSDSFTKVFNHMSPIGRMATEEDLMGVFDLLSGRGSDYMAGEIVVVDGGWTVI